MEDVVEAGFRCNRCWQPLTEATAYITSCGHIFCSTDADSWFNMRQDCPVCMKVLVRRGVDLRQVDLSPDSELAQMSLWGMQPKHVLRCAESAVNFWQLQKAVEATWLDSARGGKEKQAKEAEQELRQQRMEDQNAIGVLNQKLTSVQDELRRTVKHAEMLKKELEDKDRQCRMYEKLYNSSRQARSPMTSTLRQRGMSVALSGASAAARGGNSSSTTATTNNNHSSSTNSNSGSSSSRMDISSTSRPFSSSPPMAYSRMHKDSENFAPRSNSHPRNIVSSTSTSTAVMPQHQEQDQRFASRSQSMFSPSKSLKSPRYSSSFVSSFSNASTAAPVPAPHQGGGFSHGASMPSFSFAASPMMNSGNQQHYTNRQHVQHQAERSSEPLQAGASSSSSAMHPRSYSMMISGGGSQTPASARFSLFKRNM